ncbi:MAG: divalent-cation tolerance protein CutA [Candidatus Hermodarchaeota archaeon]
MDYYIFLVTVPNIEEGKKIGKYLVENKIAACVNIIHNIFSIYEWKNEIQEDNEHLLLIKTTENKIDVLINEVLKIHSYENPECIALKIENGSKKYLNWIREIVNQTN